MPWKSTSLRETTLETVEEHQLGDESIDQCIRRVFDAHGSPDADDVSPQSSGELHHEEPQPALPIPDNVLTEAHIDDIANRVARLTAEEIESRFR